MFTHEGICQSIEELWNQPMTPGSVHVLANLMYIKAHRKDIPEEKTWVHKNSEGHGLTRDMAMEWTRKMQNADGTTGPHWTMEKTEEARAQRGINCEPLAFWVAMNMIYSDYAKVAEKVNANNMDFYVYMARAFLEDKDARNQGGEKLARYYEYVVM